MFSGKTLLVLGLGLSLCLTTLAATAAGLLRPAIDFPLSVDSYYDEQIPGAFRKLTGRIQREPLNLVAVLFRWLVPSLPSEAKEVVFPHARIEQLSQIRSERGSCGLPSLPYPIKLHDIWSINASERWL
jgi:hypothetical protein